MKRTSLKLITVLTISLIYQLNQNDTLKVIQRKTNGKQVIKSIKRHSLTNKKEYEPVAHILIVANIIGLIVSILSFLMAYLGK